MSGFACVVNLRGGPVDPDLVSALGRSLEHRGPDGVSSHVRGPVGLVFAALHATPEAGSQPQPYRHPGGMVYMADIRLDNRPELMSDLGWDQPAATTDDVTLVAEAHQRWGSAFVDRLVGDFAIVILHPDDRVEVIRDHMGIKPVHHRRTGDWFVVASELRQTLLVPGGRVEVDPAMAGEYLSGVVEDVEATAVAGVRRLPAAHRLSFRSGESPRTECYWHPALDEPIVLGGRDEYRERLRELFDQAVDCRLRAVGPVGCELSGGLDSTSIAARARTRSDDVLALSCLFPAAGRSDERSFIDLAVDRLDLRWEPVMSDPDRPRWVADDVAFWHDIPLPPDGPDHVEVGRRVRAAGGRVVLTGHGGDHWLDVGSVILFELLAAGRPRTAWSMASTWSDGLADTALTVARPIVDRFKPDWLGRPGARRAPWVAGAARSGARLDERRVPGRLGPVYRTNRAQAAHRANSSGYEAMTRGVLDRCGALAGVEARHPYLDRRLMEFACRIPASIHAEVGRNRTLQRDALADLLPPETVNRRSKASFSEVWWQEIVRHLPDDRLTASGLVDRGWIDLAETRNAMDRTRAVMGRGGGAGQCLGLWGVVQIDALVDHVS